jgi:ATP-dependent RNA helicase SUPV3L1/SUV3
MGWLAPGTTLLLPDVRLGDLPEVGQGARSRISRRLLAFARDWVSELLTPLHPGGMEAVSPGVRGLVYQLDQGLGTARSEDVAEQLAHLDAADLAQLERLGVEVGARVVHVRALLGAEAFASRVTLVRVFFQLPSWAAPRPGMTSLPAARGTPPRAYLAVGYPVFGPRAVRADIVERAARALMVEGEDRSDARLSSLLGCPMRELRGVVEALAP